MLTHLEKYQIILASKSPRRRELLEMLRIPFSTVVIGGIKEEYPAELDPLKVPEYLSRLKADVYRKHFNGNELIITADTVVVCEGRILGKPKGGEEACRMLSFLSGRTHEVATGVTVTTQERMESLTSVTKVSFAPLSDKEIDYYVNTYHPFDKAGAYGIQEWIGAVAVQRIDGSYYNVMGLPVHRLYNMLLGF